MAVKVQCSKCKETLELDEGFRGGVCRCNCGALLQVPRSTSEGAAKVRPAAPTPLQPRPISPSPTATADASLSDPRSSAISGSGFPRPAPVAHARKKKKTSAPPKESTQQTLPASPPLPRHLTQIHRNTLLFRIAIGLSILIALSVLALVALNFFR